MDMVKRMSALLDEPYTPVVTDNIALEDINNKVPNSNADTEIINQKLTAIYSLLSTYFPPKEANEALINKANDILANINSKPSELERRYEFYINLPTLNILLSSGLYANTSTIIIPDTLENCANIFNLLQESLQKNVQYKIFKQKEYTKIYATIQTLLQQSIDRSRAIDGKTKIS